MGITTVPRTGHSSSSAVKLLWSFPWGSRQFGSHAQVRSVPVRTMSASYVAGFDTSKSGASQYINSFSCGFVIGITTNRDLSQDCQHYLPPLSNPRLPQNSTTNFSTCRTKNPTQQHQTPNTAGYVAQAILPTACSGLSESPL